MELALNFVNPRTPFGQNPGILTFTLLASCTGSVAWSNCKTFSARSFSLKLLPTAPTTSKCLECKKTMAPSCASRVSKMWSVFPSSWPFLVIDQHLYEKYLTSSIESYCRKDWQSTSPDIIIAQASEYSTCKNSCYGI